MVAKYKNNGKVKKQILLDETSVSRYGYSIAHILKSVVGNSKMVAPGKNFEKVIIFCPEEKVLNWIS